MQASCQPTGHSLLDVKHEELARAFASFTQAAAWLERSYGQLEKEVVRLRRELEDANRDLARNQALAEMAALLAHEIRNPLGSLELFAGLLAETNGSSTSQERAEWVAQVQAGLRTLSATVNNVLHFYSLPGAALTECDLGDVLDCGYEFVAPLAQQSGVRMEISNALHGVNREADPHRLQQVLLNLTLNALRFTPSGGRIRFEGKVLREDAAAEIEVRDSGAGIAREHLAEIFKRGFSTRAGSPGLGLAVCKNIVEQHGGTIRASSEAGEGATFTVRFPLP